MKIKCGIIGLPNIGKSTLFNILTNNNVENKNFPFCTIKPNLGLSQIENYKIKKIHKITNTPKIKIPSLIYIDIAGIIKNAHKGLGLGNKFLKNIKKTNILIHVIRIFKNKKIININKNINPIRDINIINNELILYDLIKLNKIKKTTNTKKLYLIKYCIKKLENKKKINLNKFNINDKNIINNLNLLSNKHTLYLLNIENKKNETNIIKKTKKYLKINKNNYLTINIKKYKNRKNYIHNDKIYKIKKICCKLLKIKFFVTINKLETTIWFLQKSFNILNAAKLIHSDFVKKFIKAKIINYKNFIKYKGWNIAQKKGKIKLIGKNYKIKNWDIIYFLINK